MRLESTFYNYLCKEFERYSVVNGELYHQDCGGALARPLSLIEAKEELFQIHDLSYIEDYLNLYRCLQT